MKVWNRMIALLLVLLMICGMMSGCSDEETYEETDTLSFRWIEDLTGAFSGWFQLYKSTYSDVTFELDRYSVGRDSVSYAYLADQLQAYYDDTRMGLMKGTSADLLVLSDEYRASTASVTAFDYEKVKLAGAFADLQPIMKADGSGTLFNPAYLEMIAYEGNIYELPYFAAIHYLRTTEQMVETYDFPYDPDDTLPEFLLKCSEWKDAHADDPDAPQVMSLQTWEYLEEYMLILSGLDTVDYEKRTANFEHPDIRTMLICMKNIQPTDDRMQDFGSVLFGTWPLSMEMQLPEEDCFLLMPLRRTDGQITAVVRHGFVISSQSENKLNAYRFAKTIAYDYYTNPETFSSGVWSGTFTVFDTEESYTKKVEAMEGRMTEDYLRVMLDAYRDVADISHNQCWQTILQDQFDDYYNGILGLDELVVNIQDKLVIYASE